MYKPYYWLYHVQIIIGFGGGTGGFLCFSLTRCTTFRQSGSTMNYGRTFWVGSAKPCIIACTSMAWVGKGWAREAMIPPLWFRITTTIAVFSGFTAASTFTLNWCKRGGCHLGVGCGATGAWVEQRLIVISLEYVLVLLAWSRTSAALKDFC